MDACRSLALAAALLLPLAAWQIAGADPAPAYRTAGEAAAALAQAQGALAQARARGEKLEAQAQAATAAADRTAQEAAAIAARIQQSEAEIRISEARIALIDKERADLRLRMAARQEPLVRLTAALQLFARRPLAFSLLRAESLRDTVYLRAVLETMVPEVRRRTATLRSAIVRGRLLQEQARGKRRGCAPANRGWVNAASSLPRWKAASALPAAPPAAPPAARPTMPWPWPNRPATWPR